MSRKHLGPYTSQDGAVLRGLYWVNGSLMNVSRVCSVRKVRPGEYEIETFHNGTWRVEGGRHRGGSKTDWFLDQGENDPNPFMRVTGLRDAVRLIETM